MGINLEPKGNAFEIQIFQGKIDGKNEKGLVLHDWTAKIPGIDKAANFFGFEKVELNGKQYYVNISKADRLVKLIEKSKDPSIKTPEVTKAVTTVKTQLLPINIKKNTEQLHGELNKLLKHEYNSPGAQNFQKAVTDYLGNVTAGMDQNNKPSSETLKLINSNLEFLIGLVKTKDDSSSFLQKLIQTDGIALDLVIKNLGTTLTDKDWKTTIENYMKADAIVQKNDEFKPLFQKINKKISDCDNYIKTLDSKIQKDEKLNNFRPRIILLKGKLEEMCNDLPPARELHQKDKSYYENKNEAVSDLRKDLVELGLEISPPTSEADGYFAGQTSSRIQGVKEQLSKAIKEAKKDFSPGSEMPDYLRKFNDKMAELDSRLDDLGEFTTMKSDQDYVKTLKEIPDEIEEAKRQLIYDREQAQTKKK